MHLRIMRQAHSACQVVPVREVVGDACPDSDLLRAHQILGAGNKFAWNRFHKKLSFYIKMDFLFTEDWHFMNFLYELVEP
uniref:Uncharacterized protein n=1 Tax=Picea glauca TaxID=3330 RepID=A0A101LZ57_PICGL|nr:hypothetical protein ABT39_MTgene4888 [Picea glauca]